MAGAMLKLRCTGSFTSFFKKQCHLIIEGIQISKGLFTLAGLCWLFLFLFNVIMSSKIILVVILEADVRLTSPQLPEFFLLTFFEMDVTVVFLSLEISPNCHNLSVMIGELQRRWTVSLTCSDVLWTDVHPAGYSFPSSITLPYQVLFLIAYSQGSSCSFSCRSIGRKGSLCSVTRSLEFLWLSGAFDRQMLQVFQCSLITLCMTGCFTYDLIHPQIP